ncbi:MULTISPECIES: DeoR/GlpR family DNA-binding transcription regulator [Methylobacterium]|jgi:DeoR/GlpR family transcriptional regulator of sugar metabolism|uniref:DeoR/GlpR family DNA-binding transcription regulator n=1 Tax=Methylobacterium TaxID=407 RepID=UPI0011C79C7A|nr:MULTISPECIES: DeoR/GlpR family DNA-binding transcription regulator [Methylobacterium]TXN68297.1 DeoR/GlpR transcriptional regulator [Methylobacterium sp. WL18]GJE19738.1 Glucitol operon repressor [Methylobacterium mesophilicum]
MRGTERRARLLEALGLGEIDVDDLARRFGVSASTVRRDLQHLSDTKAVRRTYGGAILAAAMPETTLDQRLAINGPEKQAIARAALALIADGETLILDAGSTVTAFGRLLIDRRLRIITNNLALLPCLAQAPGIDLVVLGGSLRATSMSTVGPLAVEALQRMTADRTVMSADGVVAGRGLCEASLDQVALKSVMIAQARETIVLANAGKLGRAEQMAWAPLPRRWTLVTDATVPADERRHLADAGAFIIVADP